LGLGAMIERMDWTCSTGSACTFCNPSTNVPAVYWHGLHTLEIFTVCHCYWTIQWKRQLHN